VVDSEIGEEFPLTSWELVRSAAVDPAARSELCERYFRPTYAFFRRLGCSQLDAEDLTQEFFARQLLDGRFLTSAREERGSFRSLLRTSLSNLRIDLLRRERGRDYERPRVLSSEEAVELATVDALIESDAPDQAFDRAWAHALLEDALRDAEAECRRKGQECYWEAFERLRIWPVRSGGTAPSLGEVGAMSGVDASVASNRIETVQRRVIRHLERRAGLGCLTHAEREVECRRAKAILLGG
jgi:RNA polymerase sigma factor (sigma-70 family)